jgi:hypothetical protein
MSLRRYTPFRFTSNRRTNEMMMIIYNGMDHKKPKILLIRFPKMTGKQAMKAAMHKTIQQHIMTFLLALGPTSLF